MTDHLTALHASKRKATRQRDNWKARAERYREALELIRRDAVDFGKDWCAEVARRAVLAEADKMDTHP